VILGNLKKAFPEKSDSEIRAIAGRYYRNLSDIMLEVLKTRGMKSDELIRHFDFRNYDLIEGAFRKQKSVIVAIGHSGNWEWMGPGLWLNSSQRGFAVIKPLSDPRFDQFLTSIRHKFNNNCTIKYKEAFRKMARNCHEMLNFTIIAADQTPTRGEINYWTNFLGQQTPFFLGIEKIARALDLTVVFIDLHRTSRGYYQGDIKLITDDPKNTAEFEITEGYVRLLEQSIRNRPDNWLWSHRRWKHKPSGRSN
jgi:KDO2-lipid IV(A) lauroyltransferase